MAACAASTVVLLASVPFGFLEARLFYGPAVDGIKQLPTPPPGVSAVILGWIALTLAILACWILALWRPGRLQRRAAPGPEDGRPLAEARAPRGAAGE